MAEERAKDISGNAPEQHAASTQAQEPFVPPEPFGSAGPAWEKQALGPGPALREGADGNLLTDACGIITRADETAAMLLGTKLQFLPGSPLAFLLRREDRRGFYHCLVQFASGWPATAQRQARPLAQDARRRRLLLVGTTALAADGKPSFIRWLVRDITRRRETLRALRAARAFSTDLLDAAQAIVLVLDAVGGITRANAYVGLVTGYLPSEVKQQNWCQLLIPRHDRPEARRLLSEADQSGMARSGALGLRTRTQEERTIVWSVRRLAKASQREAYLLVGQDVTDLMRAQEAALQAERLATIGRTIAGLAHEGRNALQRIQGAVSMLATRLEHDARALELVDRIQHAQDDLHRLFEDVRDYAGPIHLEPEFIDVGATVARAWEDMKVEGIELVAEISEPVPECVADPYRIRQVFRNLLENAIAVTPAAAPVEFRCRTTEMDGAAGVCVTIRDHGGGFAAEHLEKAFEPFYTTKTRGTGLGLSICRRIVEAHGGRITLANAAGGGAEVSVFLPQRLRLSIRHPSADGAGADKSGGDGRFERHHHRADVDEPRPEREDAS